MTPKRQKATSFERIDFDIHAEPVRPPSRPPSAPEATPRVRPPAPSMPPDEIQLPRRFDPHNTGRLDTGFAQFQQRGPFLAFLVVMFVVFSVALVLFLGVGLSMVVMFG